MKDAANVKPKWTCVALDETVYFSIEEEDKPFVEKIVAVYYFDANEVTFCCSAQPSYFLRALRYSVHFKGDPSEEVRERISGRIESEYPADGYYHTHDIDTVATECKAEYGDVDEDEGEDEVREYWQGNHVL